MSEIKNLGQIRLDRQENMVHGFVCDLLDRGMKIADLKEPTPQETPLWGMAQRMFEDDDFSMDSYALVCGWLEAELAEVELPPAGVLWLWKVLLYDAPASSIINVPFANKISGLFTSQFVSALLSQAPSHEDGEGLRGYIVKNPRLLSALIARWRALEEDPCPLQQRKLQELGDLLGGAHPLDALSQAMEKFIAAQAPAQVCDLLLMLLGVPSSRLGKEGYTPGLHQKINALLIRWMQEKTKTGLYDPTLNLCPEDQWLLEQGINEDLFDERPTIFLYSKDALMEFSDWTSTRDSVDIVKPWRAKLVCEDPRYSAQLNKYKYAKYRIRRLALARPAMLAMDELRAGFPHFEGVIEQLIDYLSLAVVGNGMFALPPLLMSGPPGTGKTFFFQELADKVSTTYRVLNMESVTGGFSVVGLETSWNNATPGVVFDTLLKEGASANPIILLDELDKAPITNSPVAPVLLSLLEPHSARRFTDRCLPLEINASHVNWVATANDLSKIDAPLKSRFEIIEVPHPDYHARRALAGNIYRSLLAKNHWGPWFEKQMSEETMQALAEPENAARDLRKNLTRALARAARAKRNRVHPEDLMQMEGVNEAIAKVIGAPRAS